MDFGDNLHEISETAFWAKKQKNNILLSAEYAHSMVEVMMH